LARGRLTILKGPFRKESKEVRNRRRENKLEEKHKGEAAGGDHQKSL